jgi:AraC-like DNA-binding protein
VLDAPVRITWDLRTPDLSAIRRAIGRFLKPFSLEAASSGRYDARLCHRRLTTSELTLIDYGNAAVVDAGRMTSFYLVQIPLRGSYTFTTDGARLRVGHGQAHLIHPRMYLRMECSAECQLLVLRTTDCRLAELESGWLRTLTDAQVGYVVSCASGAGASLGRVVDYLAAELMQGSLIRPGSEFAATAESLLLGALLKTVDQHRHPPPADSPDCVARAETHILANLGGDLSAREIAVACGVSPRTLYHGFHGVHGEGPMSWVRKRRLERVRAELLVAAGPASRVSDIALRWGFTHFGHFCAAYRRQFGETPTQTRSGIAHAPRRSASQDRRSI